jgi:hypothetical protein
MDLSKVNLSAIPLADLEALDANQLDKVSLSTLKLLSGEEYDTGETLTRGFERGVTSTFRGLSQFFGNDLDFYNKQFGFKTDLEREQEFRVMQETNPVAAFTGLIAGSVVDPVNLLPIGTAKNIKQFIGQGAAVGGTAGLLEPTYEEQYDDSRLLNTAAGTALGGVIGGAVGKLIEKFGRKVTDDILNTGTVTPDGQEIITPHFKLRLDENGEWVQEELPVTEAVVNARKQAAERRETEQLDAASTPTVQEPVLAATQVAEKQALPVLPNFLSGAKPRFFKSELDFETDIDKALYIVGNPSSKSARHEDYMSFLEQSLKLNRDDIVKLGAEVRKEVVDAGKLAQKQAGMTGVKEVPRVSFGLSKTVDKLLNPADKYLDDLSKRVYNIGAGYKTSPKGYAVLNPKQATEALSVLRRVDPDVEHGLMDASQKAVAYRRYLDDMKALKGKDYQPRSFDDFVKKGLGSDDQIRLIAAGSFDGCI